MASPVFARPDQCYIQQLTSGGAGWKLFFQFMPEDITDTKAAVFQDYPIIARSIPLKAYSFSTSKIVTLVLQFFATPIEKELTPTIKDIMLKIQQLRGCVYANYDKGTRPPNPVLLRVGNWIAMKAVITQVSVKASKIWASTDEPTSPSSLSKDTTIAYTGPVVPWGADVTVTFEEIGDIPLGYDEVEQGIEAKAFNR
jgi:hypothetical protein